MIERVAFLAMHTSPLDQPGRGYAGGMNVYVQELACSMAGRGIEVVVFTRRNDGTLAEQVRVEPGYTVVAVPAGPERPLPVAELPTFVTEYAEYAAKWLATPDVAPDIIHSHYWLSGWAGVLVKESIGAPLVNSFHTLGRIKDLNRRADEAPSSPVRTLTETEVIARADGLVASTDVEGRDLIEHYGAVSGRVFVASPGIDHNIFFPGDRREARRWLGLGHRPIILYVGRIEPHKGIDVAIRAVAPMRDVELLVLGGPSGTDGPRELASLRSLARQLGIGDRVQFLPPQPHDRLVEYYRAADVLVLPSRSESFGLVAAEAQACGLPVVAARVGGLTHTVADGRSGLLVDDHDPRRFGSALQVVIEDADLKRRLRLGAIEKASSFRWDATVDGHLDLYETIIGP